MFDFKKNINKFYIALVFFIVLCVVLGTVFSKKARSVKIEQAAKREEEVKLEKEKMEQLTDEEFARFTKIRSEVFKEIDWEDVFAYGLPERKPKEWWLVSVYGTAEVGFDSANEIILEEFDAKNKKVIVKSASSKMLTNRIDPSKEKRKLLHDSKSVNVSYWDTTKKMSEVQNNTEKRILEKAGVIREANDRFQNLLTAFIKGIKGDEWTCEVIFI